MRFVTVLAVLHVLARSSEAQNYVAEGYFVVDDQVVQKYVSEIPGSIGAASKRAIAVQRIGDDVDYILTEVNKLLDTLKPTVNIQVKIRSLNILSTNVFTSGFMSPGVITVRTALLAAENWLIKQNAYNQLNYDFAMIYTGYDLYGNNGPLSAGVAYIAEVCSPTKSVQVVEFNATYATAVHTAKYLGYGLGASEDGAVSENIMVSSNWPSDAHRWSFSTCSTTFIKAFIDQLSPNCLLETSLASRTPRTSWDSYTGLMFDPDVICQRRMNDARSYMCKSWGIYDDQPPCGDIVCQSIYCQVPGTTWCRDAFTSEGMACDANGRCDRGRCADTSSRASPNECDCLWGDQKELVFTRTPFQGTCSDLFAQYGIDECYNEYIRGLCCETCASHATGPPGCEYGDRNPTCTDYTRSGVCPRNSEVCCDYCAGYRGKRSVGFDLGVTLNFTSYFSEEDGLHKIQERVDPVEG